VLLRITRAGPPALAEGLKLSRVLQSAVRGLEAVAPSTLDFSQVVVVVVAVFIVVVVVFIEACSAMARGNQDPQIRGHRSSSLQPELRPFHLLELWPVQLPELRPFHLPSGSLLLLLLLFLLILSPSLSSCFLLLLLPPSLQLTQARPSVTHRHSVPQLPCLCHDAASFVMLYLLLLLYTSSTPVVRVHTVLPRSPAPRAAAHVLRARSDARGQW